MKLNAVNNRQIRQNNNTNKNTNFTGFAEGLVKAWQIIDSSRGIQFTVEDMLGTNIPRTYQGAMAGHEYTGKINWPYLLQEGIREFLTGPTMTCAPIAILAGATKLSGGKTVNTHVENIKNLSYIAGQLANEKKETLNEKEFKTGFIGKVVEDLLTKSTGKKKEEISEQIKDFTKKVQDYSEAPQKNKEDKKKASKLLSNIDKAFERIIKEKKDNFENTNFAAAKYSIAENASGETNIKNYINYTVAYADDYAKKNTKDGFVDLTKDTIKKFTTNACTKRVATVGAMIVGTGILMSFIPKIYTLASGGINPGGAAIYNEAARREGK